MLPTDAINDLLRQLFRGEDIAATAWFTQPSESLGGKIPCDVMDEPDGETRVREALEGLVGRWRPR